MNATQRLARPLTDQAIRRLDAERLEQLGVDGQDLTLRVQHHQVSVNRLLNRVQQAIAADLGLADFRDADLLKPDVSLRFGAYYLAAQIDGFGGSLQAALAAYNGGPGNAGLWSDAAGGDPDLLLELIDDPQDLHRYHFWSLHPGGANWAMADGSVRFIEYSAGGPQGTLGQPYAPTIIGALATRAAEEIIDWNN